MRADQGIQEMLLQLEGTAVQDAKLYRRLSFLIRQEGHFEDKICQNCAIFCHFCIVFELKPPFAFTESISFQDKVIEESFSFPKWAYSYIQRL